VDQLRLEAAADFDLDLVAGDRLSSRVKETWTTVYVNTLPDSAFLYIAPGGKKDSEGKTTPRSLRYFPYKDGSGKVDLPHLRNALSRIPQSNLPDSVKRRLLGLARRKLDQQNGKSAEQGESVKQLMIDVLLGDNA
jgi:hypothetical protein